MNPYRRSALFLIRLIAFGLALFTVLQLGAYVFYLKTNKKPADGRLAITLKIIPGLVGLGLMIKSGAIARKLTEDFDE
jgi:hypothetical protein